MSWLKTRTNPYSFSVIARTSYKPEGQSSVAKQKKTVIAAGQLGVAGRLQELHCTDETQIGQNSCLRFH